MNSLQRAYRCLPAIWWVLLACLLAVRISTVIHFGACYTGSDDVLFWAVAKDFAQGIFREPYLYGQNYNPPLESLLAVPFLLCHVPMHVAMPLSTSLLALAPFISFSLWYRCKREWLAGIAFLAVPLLLPAQWDLITTMSRGFVTGVAALAALPWALQLPSLPWRSATIGFILGIALYLNPNSIIFSGPFAVWFLLADRRGFKRLFLMVAGSMPPLLMQYLSVEFYTERPWRIVHRIDDWRMTFHPLELLPEGLQQLDLHFQWLMPLAPSHGSWVLIVLALLVILAAWQREYRVAWAIGTVFPIILVSLSFPKVYDGFSHVLYPYSRMYLAMPLLLAWALAQPRWRKASVAIPALALVCITAAFLKMYRMEALVEEAMRPMTGVPVGSWPYPQYKEYVKVVDAVARQEEADLIVALDGPEGMLHLALSYGGGIVQPDLPPTLYVGLDRRWWRRQEEGQAKHSAILFVGGDEALWASTRAAHPGFVDLSSATDAFHLVHPGGLTTTQVMERLGRKW